MTREELKAHCEEQVATCEAFWAEDEEKLKNHRLYQEHKLILELLEQELCEDCISRQVVKDKYRERLINNLTDADRGIDLSKYAEEPYKTFCEFINSIPSVTPKSKTAHWIHFASGDDCSECGWSTGKYIDPTNYCPNCGAKMQVESEVRHEQNT